MSTTTVARGTTLPQQPVGVSATAQAPAPAAAGAPQPPLRVAAESIPEPSSYEMPDTLTWLQSQMQRPGLSQTQVSALYEVHQQLLNVYQQALAAWRT